MSDEENARTNKGMQKTNTSKDLTLDFCEENTILVAFVLWKLRDLSIRKDELNFLYFFLFTWVYLPMQIE